MADNETQGMDGTARLLAADPHANVVEGEGTTIWLVNGDQMRLARDLVAKKPSQ